jgi:hypothetical protein
MAGLPTAETNLLNQIITDIATANLSLTQTNAVLAAVASLVPTLGLSLP